jgi:hypothetical protein
MMNLKGGRGEHRDVRNWLSARFPLQESWGWENRGESSCVMAHIEREGAETEETFASSLGTMEQSSRTFSLCHQDNSFVSIYEIPHGRRD